MARGRKGFRNVLSAKGILYVVATIVMAVLIVLLLCVSVQSGPRSDSLFDNSRYVEREAAYKAEIATILREYHCEDSGVMLTHTVEPDGTRRYLLRLHNRRFALLETGEFQELEGAVRNVTISDWQNEPIEIEVDMGYTTI